MFEECKEEKASQSQRETTSSWQVGRDWHGPLS